MDSTDDEPEWVQSRCQVLYYVLQAMYAQKYQSCHANEYVLTAIQDQTMASMMIGPMICPMIDPDDWSYDWSYE